MFCRDIYSGADMHFLCLEYCLRLYKLFIRINQGPVQTSNFCRVECNCLRCSALFFRETNKSIVYQTQSMLSPDAKLSVQCAIVVFGVFLVTGSHGQMYSTRFTTSGRELCARDRVLNKYASLSFPPSLLFPP